MDVRGEIEIVDREGWSKKQPLVKTITLVGSDPTSDVVLDARRGGKVAPRHAQIIYWPSGNYGYRLVNLGDAEIRVGAGGERTLAPRSTIQVGDGETFEIGDFTLILRAAGAARQAAAAGSGHIGLDLRLPGTPLAPDRTMEGVILLGNLGEQSNVQFEVDVEGLPAECYEVEPAPLLFPGAEEQVRLRVYHQGGRPAAGNHQVCVRVTAPEAYPAEEATIARSITVLPCYRHRLRMPTLEETEPEAPPAAERSAARESKPETPAQDRKRWARLLAWLRRLPRALPGGRSSAGEPPVRDGVADEAGAASPAARQGEEQRPPQAPPAAEARSPEDEAWASAPGEPVHPPSPPAGEAAASAEQPARKPGDTSAAPGAPAVSLWVAPDAEFGPPPARVAGEASSPPSPPAPDGAGKAPERAKPAPGAAVEDPPLAQSATTPDGEAAAPPPVKPVATEAAKEGPAAAKPAAAGNGSSPRQPEVPATEPARRSPGRPQAERASKGQPAAPPAPEQAQPAAAERAAAEAAAEKDIAAQRPAAQQAAVQRATAPRAAAEPPARKKAPALGGQSAPSSRAGERDWWAAERNEEQRSQPAGDWWAAEAESPPPVLPEGGRWNPAPEPPAIEEGQVRVLKAQVPPDEEAELPGAAVPQEEGDWWAAEPAEDERSEEVEE